MLIKQKNIAYKKLIFKNNAPFRSGISKISNTYIDSAEDLDIVIPMYNLLEHMATILWHQKVCGTIIEIT